MPLKNDPEWRPRITVTTTEERFFALQKNIPWGMRDKLFNAFADELIRIGEQLGPVAYGLLSTRGFTVVMNKEENKNAGSVI